MSLLRSSATAFALAAVMALGSSAHARPERAEAGRRYAGGTELLVAELGVTLRVPAGWIAAIQGEALMIGSDTEPGLILVTGDAKSSIAEIARQLSEPWPLEGVLLVPEGPAKTGGGKVSQRYDAETEQGHLVGIARAMVLGRQAIAVIGLGPVAASKRVESVIGQIERSFRRATNAEVGQASEGWIQRIRGKSLVYMRTSGSLSTKHEINLCQDGRFVSSSDDTYVTYDASGVARSGRAGTWTVKGSTLVLEGDDGSSSSYRLSREGEKTLLDGTRYFVVDGGC